MKKDYIQNNKAAFALQMANFKANIGGYAATFGLTPAEVAAQEADSDAINYVTNANLTLSQSDQAWSSWYKILRSGGNLPAAGAPLAPSLGAPPDAVDPGIEQRFRALVQRITKHANYTAAIGEALGIEGEQSSDADLTTAQPHFKLKLGGGAVTVGWSWGGLSNQVSMIRIEVERGEGTGFNLLANDTTPGYADTQPLPTTPTKWTYRAMFYVGDQPAGQWSDPVSIIVGA